MATKTKKPARAGKPVRAKRTVSQPVVEPRQEKSAFRLSTLITVLIFAGVVAAAIYMNRQSEAEADAGATSEAESSFLITSEALVSSIEVAPLEGATAKLERNEEKAWVLTKPEKGEADQGLAEAAASQIVALRVITPLEDVSDPSIYGLDKPDYVITIGFDDGVTSVIEVGDLTPSETGYYVRMGDKYYVAAVSGISALTNLAVTPPYLAVESTPAP